MHLTWLKGHGTENDFVLLPDLDARLSLAPAVVSALCDRRRGLGADGVLRVTTAVPADTTIAVSNGERLYELAPNKDELWIVPGANHNELWAAGIWEKAQAFFARHGAAS